MPSPSFPRARDIFKKPSLKKSGYQPLQHDGPRHEISVPSIDATLSLLYSPQDTVFAQGGARVSPTREYSRYASARPVLGGTWEEQRHATHPPLSARPPPQDAPTLPKRRRGSEPSNSARPNRTELLGDTMAQEAATQDVGPQRTMTLGRSWRRPGDLPSGPSSAATTPSPKRHAIFYNEQVPFLEAASQLFGPSSSAADSSASQRAPSPQDLPPGRPRARTFDLLDTALREDEEPHETEPPAEPPCEIFFTIDPACGSDDGSDVTLIFTHRPQWL
ncbi:hypothetical protein PsYK624_127640 [Phanerochaete sordida]|uniref:Uncharacterized protein n=1 Tax=Phanerochaete sordida TaxID=48140 RepID=A0A9P3LII4_9APHY|nr:hypothetical protein PsYK624_127640 [Phanerochaete sordida]